MTVALVGASFVEPSSPLVAALDAALPDGAEGFGVRGAPLARWAARVLEPDMRRRLAASSLVVVLELGGNGVPDPATVQRVHDELESQTGVRVVWVAPPRWPAGTAAADARARTLAALERAGVPLLRSGWVPSDAQVSRDGVHLTTAGYRALANALAPSIKAVLGAAVPPWAPPAVALVLACVLWWLS